MQAILTKYLPATNSRGSRVKATCERGSIAIPFPHETDIEGAHVAAADALVSKFIEEDAKEYKTPRAKKPWGKQRACGGLPGGGYCHVFIS